MLVINYYAGSILSSSFSWKNSHEAGRLLLFAGGRVSIWKKIARHCSSCFMCYYFLFFCLELWPFPNVFSKLYKVSWFGRVWSLKCSMVSVCRNDVDGTSRSPFCFGSSLTVINMNYHLHFPCSLLSSFTAHPIIPYTVTFSNTCVDHANKKIYGFFF